VSMVCPLAETVPLFARPSLSAAGIDYAPWTVSPSTKAADSARPLTLLLRIAVQQPVLLSWKTAWVDPTLWNCSPSWSIKPTRASWLVTFRPDFSLRTGAPLTQVTLIA